VFHGFLPIPELILVRIRTEYSVSGARAGASAARW
jgi:hypothetical protein